MEVTFKLTYLDGLLRGPEKTILLENPDPHPNALRMLAREWAETQTEKTWDSVLIAYDGKVIRAQFKELLSEET